MPVTKPRVSKKISPLSPKRNAGVLTVETQLSTHAEIATRARLLHQRSGRPSGRDVEFWLEAERQLRVELNA
jgi:hypothetical protein